ncbi:hypothetical protein P3T76_001968 [Phytophthora citrophthora]|uniref:Uncharacterized protein n=1 Tax=Phytophthora citrophthora TaxID=4793 RepID=A0AAD9LQW2_9STRA|nr:hypothetical protein P3T76_001968 [Phytophthora citrophthora]
MSHHLKKTCGHVNTVYRYATGPATGLASGDTFRHDGQKLPPLSFLSEVFMSTTKMSTHTTDLVAAVPTKSSASRLDTLLSRWQPLL